MANGYRLLLVCVEITDYERDMIIPKKMNYEKASADDDLSKANLFATYFASVYTHSTTFHQTSENSDVKVISDILFSEKEVMTICKDLKINKSKGPDGLPPLLFKKICLSIPHSLCQLYRKIFQTGIFPDLWKQAVVIPIFKKGCKSDVTNYRPVSLLSIPSKIFEHILFKKLYEHCAEYLHVSQYGFRKNRSPIIQLITFLQKVYNGIDINKISTYYLQISVKLSTESTMVFYYKNYMILVYVEIYSKFWNLTFMVARKELG